LPRVVLL